MHCFIYTDIAVCEVLFVIILISVFVMCLYTHAVSISFRVLQTGFQLKGHDRKITLIGAAGPIVRYNVFIIIIIILVIIHDRLRIFDTLAYVGLRRRIRLK